MSDGPPMDRADQLTDEVSAGNHDKSVNHPRAQIDDARC